MAKEKILTINLRKAFLKYPKWKRSKRASTFLREFLKQKFKVEKVKIDPEVSKAIWRRGGKKPPSKIRVKVIKVDEKTLEVKKE